VKRPLLPGLVLLALGMAAAIVAIAIQDDGAPARSLGKFDVPDVGVTEPVELVDGRPVFVSTDLDGAVSVVAAVSTHLPGDQMGWCPESRTIEDVPHGGRFDVKGRYLSGPGTSDLGTYTVEIDGSSLVVLSFIEPTGRSDIPYPEMTGDCAHGGYEIHPYYED